MADRISSAVNAWTRMRATSWWPWVSRSVTAIFFALVAWLMVSQARTVAWPEVLRSLTETPARVLLGAAALALATYYMYATFDLVGRRYAGHRLSKRAVLGIGCISYAFNLNLGTLIGGVAVRYRLYSRMGVEPARTAHVTVLSMLTNWIGYCLLAGILFWFWPPDLPDRWKISTSGLQAIGAALALVALAYVVMCALRKGRSLKIGSRDIPLPTWPIALLQLALSAAHWMMMGAILFMLLRSRVPYPAVLATLMVAAIAGVIAHVPAGLGVLETVFVTLLADYLARNDVLAALLLYRAVYYLGPLLLAAIAYCIVELRLPEPALSQAQARGSSGRVLTFSMRPQISRPAASGRKR